MFIVPTMGFLLFQIHSKYYKVHFACLFLGFAILKKLIKNCLTLFSKINKYLKKEVPIVSYPRTSVFCFSIFFYVAQVAIVHKSI
jgi:hypothetical protein